MTAHEVDTAADYWFVANDPTNGLEPDGRVALTDAIRSWLADAVTRRDGWDRARPRPLTLDPQEAAR